MLNLRKHTTLIFAKPGKTSERMRIDACNRVLLYARGLDLDAKPSLELAGQSLERAGSEAGLEEVMAAMREILAENGHDFRNSSGVIGQLKATPPLRRRSMLAGKAEVSAPFRWIGRFVAGVCRFSAVWKAPWKTRKAR
jgi:hypothetical protein